MKVTEQYFPVVLFIMLYKVLTFEFVDGILHYGYSKMTVYISVQMNTIKR